MKKIIGAIIVVTLTILFCTGCEVSNTELANSLDGNMTRLVYSVGYLDSVSITDIQDLTTNTSYFANSSYNVNNVNGANTLRDSNYRSNVYNTSLSDGYANYVASNNNRTEQYNGIINNANCQRCNLPLTDSNSTNSVETNIDTDNITNVGNATSSALGGLCKTCQNAEFDTVSLTNINSVSNINSNNSINNTSAINDATSNFVDISLIESSASDLNEILLKISQKRGIIMLYCTDLRSGNIALSADDKSAIEEYITIIKETINYLNNNSSALSAHINNIKNIAYTEGAQELINAKLIRANEVLKTRYAKLDTCIDSLNAIIAILQRNVGIDYSASYLNNSTYQTNNTTNKEYINSTNEINKTTTESTENTTNKITTIPDSNLNTNSINTLNSPNNNSTYNSAPINNPSVTQEPQDNTIINYNYSGSTNDSYNCSQNHNIVPNNTPNTNIVTDANNTHGGWVSISLDTANNVTPSSQSNVTSSTTTSSVLDGITPPVTNNINPRGIGVKPEETSPLSGIPYDSTSVNTPKPGTLISSIEVNNDNSQINEPSEVLTSSKSNNIAKQPQNFKAIKELGYKTISLEPIYSAESTFKLLPFNQNK